LHEPLTTYTTQTIQFIQIRISFSLFDVGQSEGTLLATGSYDGFARIWTKDGELH